MGYVNWSYEELNRFCQDVFESFGFTKEEIFEDAESVEIEWYYTMNMTIIFLKHRADCKRSAF